MVAGLLGLQLESKVEVLKRLGDNIRQIPLNSRRIPQFGLHPKGKRGILGLRLDCAPEGRACALERQMEKMDLEFTDVTFDNFKGIEVRLEDYLPLIAAGD